MAQLCVKLKAHPPPYQRTMPSIDINLRFNKLIRCIASEAAAARVGSVISERRGDGRDYEMRYDVPDSIHV